MEAPLHKPVLLDEVLDALHPLDHALVVDGTFGAGGYSSAFLEAGAKVIAFDRDPNVAALGHTFEKRFTGRFRLIAAPFSTMREAVDVAPNAIVFDIGVSSMQIDDPARGFSFQKDGPLDMRMSQTGKTAADIVNNAKQSDLARLIFTLGEERHARKIAKVIAERRRDRPFLTTLDLAQTIANLLGRRPQDHIHPATRTFQALRIAVNDELGELVLGLFAAERLLAEDGKLAVVTFHSLEDRIVKRFFADRSLPQTHSRHLPALEGVEPSFTMLFKGVVSPSDEERLENPRARSAKLRVGVRTNAAPFKPDRKLFGLDLPIFDGME